MPVKKTAKSAGNEALREATAAAVSMISMFANAQKALPALAFISNAAEEVEKLQTEIQILETKRDSLRAATGRAEQQIKDADEDAKRQIATIKADVDRAKRDAQEDLRVFTENVGAAKQKAKNEMTQEREAHQAKLDAIREQIRELRRSAAA